MARFPSDRFPPGFFDLPHGAGASLPLGVIAEWTHGVQTLDVARAILAPHARRGILVATDSSGLTRLTRERTLIDILALLTHPKELIHSHGCAIGGRAMGVWAADNTVMFYPEDVAARRVVSMLRAVMRRIADECEIGIGFAAHAGDFFQLGRGAHGPHVEHVEELAEDYTEPGELLITSSLARRLGDGHGFALEPRVDPFARGERVFHVTDGPVASGLAATDVAYPAPWSDEFAAGLSEYARTRRDSRMPTQVHEDRAVVVLEREPDEEDAAEVAVLNDLALTAAMKRIGLMLLAGIDGAEVKNVGRLGIWVFADARDAVRFAEAFRNELGSQGVRCRTGIDAGRVFVFDLGGGVREIAGSAVNVASKLAQDLGDYGTIQISDEVARRASVKRDRPTLTFRIAGVDLRGYRV